MSSTWITPENTILNQLRDSDLIGYIINSSAYHKGVVGAIPANPSRHRLLRMYQRCRDYATSSIINALTPLPPDLHHLDCSTSGPFRILARVHTEWDKKIPDRHYASFCILENDNLSHFPGDVLCCYHSHITAEMIGYIYPMDANTDPAADNRLQFTDVPEILLDIDDLLAKARRHGSYCQISVFMNYKDTVGNILPLTPDCIAAIKEPDEPPTLAAERKHLPILTINPASQTICRVHDDGLAADHWNRWILPIDPNAPRYDLYDDFNIPTFYRQEDD